MQTRREFLRQASLAVTSLSTVSMRASPCAGGQTPRSSVEQVPKVLFIQCDQLNAKALGCYGSEVPTPHIDRLANEGVRFTNAACVTPFCSPSRATWITGMYPHAHGILGNVPYGGKGRLGITDADVTTEKILNQSGYTTHHYGKWHLTTEPAYYPDMGLDKQAHTGCTGLNDPISGQHAPLA